MTTAELIAHVEQAIARAERHESRLEPGGGPVINVGGFLGLRTRHLLNNLGALPGLRALEIGVLHGASLCSLCYQNEVRAVGIDNFSQFDGEAGATLAHLAHYAPGADLLVTDCWEVNAAALPGPYHLFSYDGDHSREATARAFTHFLPALADPCLVLIDDYSWEAVRAGVADGLRQAELQVVWERELFTHANDGAAWWNGLWLGVVTR